MVGEVPSFKDKDRQTTSRPEALPASAHTRCSHTACVDLCVCMNLRLLNLSIKFLKMRDVLFFSLSPTFLTPLLNIYLIGLMNIVLIIYTEFKIVQD